MHNDSEQGTGVNQNLQQNAGYNYDSQHDITRFNANRKHKIMVPTTKIETIFKLLIMTLKILKLLMILKLEELARSKAIIMIVFTWQVMNLIVLR